MNKSKINTSKYTHTQTERERERERESKIAKIATNFLFRTTETQLLSRKRERELSRHISLS